MLQEYAETRYQVELINYDQLARMTTTKIYYTDDFFDAVRTIEANMTRFHHITLFDTVNARTVFDSSELD